MENKEKKDVESLYEMFSVITEDRDYSSWDKYFHADYAHWRNGILVSKEDLMEETMEEYEDEDKGTKERVLKDVSCIHETAMVVNNDSPDYTMVGLQYDLLHVYRDDVTRKAHVCAIYKVVKEKILRCDEVIYWEPLEDNYSDKDDDSIMYM